MAESCPIAGRAETGIDVVTLRPEKKVADYLEAMALAKSEAGKRYEESMLISWYDRDRDFESPPNSSECGAGCPKNGYLLYAMSHGARLKVDVEEGRFVFFFAPVEWET